MFLDSRRRLALASRDLAGMSNRETNEPIFRAEPTTSRRRRPPRLQQASRHAGELFHHVIAALTRACLSATDDLWLLHSTPQPNYVIEIADADIHRTQGAAMDRHDVVALTLAGLKKN